MDLFSTIMSVKRIQSDFGLGQALANLEDIPGGPGDRFLDVMAAQAKKAAEPRREDRDRRVGIARVDRLAGLVERHQRRGN